MSNILIYYFITTLKGLFLQQTKKQHIKTIKNSKNVILHNIKEGFIPLLSNNINMIKKGNQKWYVIVMN